MYANKKNQTGKPTRTWLVVKGGTSGGATRDRGTVSGGDLNPKLKEAEGKGVSIKKAILTLETP